MLSLNYLPAFVDVFSYSLSKCFTPVINNNKNPINSCHFIRLLEFIIFGFVKHKFTLKLDHM